VHRVSICYGQPADPAAFDSYYNDVGESPILSPPGVRANAVNFGVVAVQRLYGGKVVAVVVISMMSSGLIERR
jgi:hypothetical protein